ncbi:MAG: hypothetical protein B7Z75_06650 [Acidocella sp. 20-57-95]|nr:MAG: hypothetical protein B7Z75_06650 [Acidocella sp. 20-57-95]HQT64823.1 ABC transporter ATP-binding protein [Acidocella sp.]
MLKIAHLQKQYDHQGKSVSVVDDLSLMVTAGSFVTLLGPSGCGKTTTLRMIAGLETPNAGSIEIDGVPIYTKEQKLHVPASRRPIAMVFQSYAIWPHMDIFQNVAFPLKSHKFNLTSKEIHDRTHEALSMVGLQEFAGRDPSALSGGQQQRVALARALVSQPKLLLLDEPLSNLDVNLRDQMRDQIKELHARTGLTTIFVTHDQHEAMALSSDIVVMDHGKIIETGPPQRIFQSPQKAFTARFVGKHNILQGKVQDIFPDNYIIIATENGNVRIALTERSIGHRLGDEMLLYIRPDTIKLQPISNATTGLIGSIVSRIYQGNHWEIKVSLGNSQTMLVHIGLTNARDMKLNQLSEVEIITDDAETIIVKLTDSGV